MPFGIAPNTLAGVRHPADESNPERVCRQGQRLVEDTNADRNGRMVDDDSMNFWVYTCWNCNQNDSDRDYFRQTQFMHQFPSHCWICDQCVNDAEHEDSNDCIDGCDCEDCENSRHRADNIEEWNFVPIPLFFRTDVELKAAEKIMNEARKKRGIGTRNLSRLAATNEDRTPFLAFEIEVENTANRVLNGDAVSNVAHDWNYAKYDGSVPTGFEIVSHPFTFDYFRRDMRKDWESMLRSLKEDGLTSFKTETCGMHVHISKSAFTNYHLYRFLRIWYFSKRFTLWLSKRNEHSFNMYAGFNKEGSFPIARKAKDKYYPEKYESINLAHPASVEIRIFRGTLHPDSFQRNIETVQAAFEFSDPYSADKVRTAGITPDGFAKFVRTHKKRFPKLHNHFWDHGHVVSEIQRETASVAKGTI